MRPAPWLARYFRYEYEYKLALQLVPRLPLSIRWPESRIPRTLNPVDFAQLVARGR